MKSFGKFAVVPFLIISWINALHHSMKTIDNFIFSMKTASKELQKLRSIAERSLNQTAELQQVLAQIEANLSRTEIQKVIQKTSYN